MRAVLNLLRPGSVGHRCEIQRHGHKPKSFWIAGRETAPGTQVVSSYTRRTSGARTSAKKKVPAKPTIRQRIDHYIEERIFRPLTHLFGWFVVLPAVLCGCLMVGTFATTAAENVAFKHEQQVEETRLKLNGVASFAEPGAHIRHRPVKKPANAKRAKRIKKKT